MVAVVGALIAMSLPRVAAAVEEEAVPVRQ
ncbi:hypothetical protein F4560_002537 [Saccharothrix ecbatanensis]|uniref:Uncharacterized protein n=1 Tax=Saccharothrix ecbatanensis TaxID=1105145 RepID=A0A7W9M0B6_9PSEU|nr:hypothetical protein [Saccharothrix ecbatanensis]